MDGVFVYLNVINGALTGCEYEINSAYARSFLNKNNIETMQYINKDISQLNQIIDELIRIKCDRFIFYINEYNYYISKVVVNILRGRNLQSTIYVFGEVTKYIVENLGNDILADVFIIDNDPITLYELMNSNNIQAVNNIAFRLDDTIITTEKRELEYDLDDLGTPYSSGCIPPEEVFNVGMLSSKGCYGNCLFCSYISRKKIKTHSINLIINELEYINYYVRDNNMQIRFLDDCFSLTQERVYKICDNIKKSNLDFQYWCCTRADLLTNEIVDIMVESNFKNCVIGLETASEKVMQGLGKLANGWNAIEYIEQVGGIFRYALDKGMNPLVSVNFGLPNEKAADAVKTIEFITSKLSTNNISVCYNTCFPGSKLFESNDSYNIYKVKSPVNLPYRTFINEFNIENVHNQLKNKRILNNEFYKLLTNENKVLNYIMNYITGYYGQKSFMKPETIEVDQLTPSTIDFVSSNIYVNGTILLYKDKIGISRKGLFVEDRKVLRLAIDDYDKNLKEANTMNKYLPNQVFYKVIDNFRQFQINNLYNISPFKLKVTNIDNLGVLSLITKRVHSMVENDELTSEDIEFGIIENSCTFIGECNVCKGSKFNISNECIYICSGTSCVGTVHENYNDIISKIEDKIEAAHERRKCSTCSEKEKCSKCISLPNFISEEQYCQIVRQIKNIDIYIMLVNLLSTTIKNKERFSTKVYLARKYNVIEQVYSNGLPVLSADTALIDNLEICLVYNFKRKSYLLCTNEEKTIVLKMLNIVKTENQLTEKENRFINKLRILGFCSK